VTGGKLPVWVVARPIDGAQREAALQQADHWAETLSLDGADLNNKAESTDCDGDALILGVDETGGLSLQELRAGKLQGRPFTPSWSKLDITSNAGRTLKQPLLKAMGLPAARKRKEQVRVIDLTAGWCEDAWLLAAFGCDVTALECQPIIAAMVEQQLERLRSEAPETDSNATDRDLNAAAEGKPRGDDDAAIASRIALLAGDSVDWLKAVDAAAIADAVLYLDPMFPGHDKRTTLPRKPMHLARQLIGSHETADSAHTAEPADDALFEAAFAARVRRVVIKRPPRAAFALGREPQIQYTGKGHRFDVYGQLL